MKAIMEKLFTRTNILSLLFLPQGFVYSVPFSWIISLILMVFSYIFSFYYLLSIYLPH